MWSLGSTHLISFKFIGELLNYSFSLTSDRSTTEYQLLLQCNASVITDPNATETPSSSTPKHLSHVPHLAQLQNTTSAATPGNTTSDVVLQELSCFWSLTSGDIRAGRYRLRLDICVVLPGGSATRISCFRSQSTYITVSEAAIPTPVPILQPWWQSFLTLPFLIAAPVVRRQMFLSVMMLFIVIVIGLSVSTNFYL
jgi:hypothetical protein